MFDPSPHPPLRLERVEFQCKRNANIKNSVRVIFCNIGVKIRQFLIRKILYISIGDNKEFSMGIAKIALNFMVKNGKGELVKSLLCHTKPPKIPNIQGLKYAPKLTEDVVQVSHSLSNFSQKSVEILKDGTKKVTGQLKWLTKDGKPLEYTLEKQYKTSKDSTDILYNVMDKDGIAVGEWFGYVNYTNGKNTLHGYSLYTNLSSKDTRGLGTELKKLILKDAKEYNYESIDILASFESHTFHNKMGYKCDINETYLDPILAILKRMRKVDTFPMFNERIDLALKDKNIPQLNKLIDDMLTEANSQGLRSSEIGISQIKIPMKLDLR